jgi:hypothetical protein
MHLQSRISEVRSDPADHVFGTVLLVRPLRNCPDQWLVASDMVTCLATSFFSRPSGTKNFLSDAFIVAPSAKLLYT